MPSGRSGTPPHLRIAGGEYRQNLPDIPEGRPSKPEFVAGDVVMSAIWDWLIYALESQTKLTEQDGESVAAACATYKIMRQAEADLAASGTTGEGRNGDVIVHPNFRIWKESATQWRTWLREFGLTPGSRNRVAAVAKKKANAYDEFKRRSAELAATGGQSTAVGE